MNSKKLLPLLSIGAALAITGCKDRGHEGDEPGEEIKHRDPYVIVAPEGAVLRDYNEKFDLMVDDFSGSSLLGTLNEGHEVQSMLRVLVDSTAAGFPGDVEAAIYKTASANFAANHPSAIGFKIRKIGGGNLKTENLILEMRGDDSVNTYPIKLSDAFDEDGEALPELSDQWQDLVVDFNNSIEDDETVYPGKDGTPSSIKVLETMVGFHLHAQSGVELSDEIEIAEVYATINNEKAVIDTFNHSRTDLNPGYDNWWVNSTGIIINKGVNINGGSYTVDLPSGWSEYANVVVSMRGDNSALKVNGHDAKDPDGNAIAAAVDGKYLNYVINFEKTGFDLSENQLVLSSTKDLDVSSIYLTNLQDVAPATEYPVIDIENRIVFDAFERTQSTFTGDWDIASTASYTPDSISVALSYSNPEKLNVANGKLTVTAPEEGAYVNLKEANGIAAQANNPYLVIVAKGELTNIEIGSAAPYVASYDWKAGPGLSTIPTDLDSYPYKTEDGFVHYIIDLKASGCNFGNSDFLEMNFRCGVEIAEIYTADRPTSVYISEDKVPADGKDLSGYHYNGWFYVPETTKYVELEFVGTGSLESVRFTGDNPENWFKDGGIYNTKGEVISKDLTFTPEESLVIRIDPVASNLLGNNHIHVGGFNGSEGTLEYIHLRTVVYNTIKETRSITLASSNFEGDGAYTYVGAIGADLGAATFIISLSADGEATLETMRIEGAETYYANANALLDENGEAITAGTVISTDKENPTVLRVAVSNLGEPKADNFYHIHWGGWGSSTANITMSVSVEIPHTAASQLASYIK